MESLRDYPSMLFGLETAFRHMEAGGLRLWETPFSRGEAGIAINGLIWMGGYKDMLRQVEGKLEAGFRCLKLKIGAIDFDSELALLGHIRRHFAAGEVEIRLDANGAFSPSEAMDRLSRLAEYDIHSVEQPVRSGQWDVMARLSALSPVPVALDEELIGCNRREDKRRLIGHIRPRYIVLKPSLHGGISGCLEWIEEATRQGAAYWVTSALESNVGLNAIAQWCATLGPSMAQGLGTGSLFTDNVGLPLQVLPSGPADPRPALWWKDVSPSPWEKGWAGEVMTSGSTGSPRVFKVKAEKMMQSARMTCLALGLKKGDRALLCMPLRYIGGRMMVARTIVGGLELTVRPPSGHPLKDEDGPFRFAAMVPLQVYNCLQTPVEKERLMKIEILIVGGGAIDPSLEEVLKGFPNAVYSTYGMTETLSHIALRRLNGAEASPCYRPLPSVALSLSEDNTLVIDAPLICDGPVVTNDIAEIMPDGSFRVLGRKDNVINSGGVKLQAEVLEEKLRPFIHGAFAVTSMPDPRLGEAVVLLVEKGACREEDILEAISSALSPYECPRHVREVASIPGSGNGKINRKACKELLLTLQYSKTQISCYLSPEKHFLYVPG
jgi:hypothetical protein